MVSVKFLVLVGLVWAWAGSPVFAAEDLWRQDLQAAATETPPKPLVLLWSIPGCVWCQRMHEESQDSAEVRTALAQTIPLYLNAEDHPALAAQLHLQAFPTLVLVNRKRQVTQMIQGYLSASDLATAVRIHVLHGDDQQGEAFGTGPDLAAIAHGADAVPQLLALLGQGATAQRVEVRQLLMGLPAAKDALWEKLDDDYLAVRVDAAAVLAEMIGPPSTYDPFAERPERQQARSAWQKGLMP